MKVTDHSGLIAHLSVLIELLTDFDPGGTWSQHGLLVAYQRDHYCLSLKQAKQLEQALEAALEHVTTSKSQQLDLLGGGDSAQS